MNVITLPTHTRGSDNAASKARGKAPQRGSGRHANRGGIVAALDVGTSKITCFIARVDAAAEGTSAPAVRVIGIGQKVSRGVRAGAVVDMDLAEEAIRAAVDQAERMAGMTVREVLVTASAGTPRSHRLSVRVAIGGQEVSGDDLSRVLKHGQTHCVTDDQAVMHAIPVGYTIDGSPRIADPIGMFGDRLGVDMHVVSASPGPLRNLLVCVERCHLEPVGVVCAPYASGLSSLVEDEIDLGVVCIDMGGGTTSISAFVEGSLLHVDVLPVGGQHVTNDIARGLSTPLAHAERMKTLSGSALASPSDEREMIDVPQVGEDVSDAANHIPKSMLTGIIQPRVEETLELVRDRLMASGIGSMVGRRVVLTGGASQLTGLRDIAARVLDKQVRLGRPLRVAGLAEATGGPAFSACAGLLLYARGHQAELATPQMLEDGVALGDGTTGRFSKIGRWLKENF